MKDTDAVIGGEGNGGIIVPELHYGRDALAGIGLFLTYLAKKEVSASTLRKTYPDYKMVKDKIDLNPNLDLLAILSEMHQKYQAEDCNTIDGLKIDFPDGWVHLRKSNTEPIIRIYAEHNSADKAEQLVKMIKSDVEQLALALR